MKLIGNIQDIKNTREDKNKAIEVHVDRVEYITQMKDGRYYQPFDYVDELNTPLVITGDCLSRTNMKPAEEGEYAFQVYDKVDDAYELNPNKELSLTVTYDFDADLTILTSVYYTITVSNEEFRKLKSEKHKERLSRKGKGRKSK
jgi:hypothetical protein